MSMQNVIGTIDFKEKRLKRRVELTSGLLNLPIVIIFGYLLELNDFPVPLLLIVIVLLIFPGIFLHEGSHYVFQWITSKNKPYFGFIFPFPFSALSPSASITRNQAILCALAPIFTVIVILVVPALFTPLLIKILMLAWASMELTTGYGDYYLTFRLLKYPPNSRLKNIDNSNVLFKSD